jgi:hypothetical protein
MCRAKEVCSHNPVLAAGLLPHQLNVNGAGIGGQDAMGGAGGLQVCKDALLQANVLQSVNVTASIRARFLKIRS